MQSRPLLGHLCNTEKNVTRVFFFKKWMRCKQRKLNNRNDRKITVQPHPTWHINSKWMIDCWGPGDLEQAQQLVGQQSWRTSWRGVCSASNEPSPLHPILSWFIYALPCKNPVEKSPANPAELESPCSLSVHHVCCVVHPYTGGVWSPLACLHKDPARPVKSGFPLAPQDSS